MSDEAWIEQSLARLEELETRKAQLEAYGGDTETVAELEAEISALYETLNDAAAGEGAAPQADTAWSDPSESAPTSSGPLAYGGDDEDEDDDADWAAAAATQSRGGSPLDAETSPFSSSPFSSSSGASFSATDDSGTYGSSGFETGPAYGDYDESDAKSSKSKLPWIGAAAALLVAVGIGGLLVSKKSDSATPAAAPVAAGDPKIITASAVPEDTQEPDAAKGADVDRTEGTVYKESSRPEPKSRASRKSGGKKRHGSGASRNHQDDGRRVTHSNSNDPLDGL